MKRLARLAVVGTIALGSTMAAASAAPIVPNGSSQTNPSFVQLWGGCGWGFHPTPWGAFQTDTATIGHIGEGTTVAGHTGAAIITVAAIILIGVSGIGTGTDG